MRKSIIFATLALILSTSPSFAGRDGETPTAPAAAPIPKVYRAATPGETAEINAQLESGAIQPKRGRTRCLSNMNGELKAVVSFIGATVLLLGGAATFLGVTDYQSNNHGVCADLCNIPDMRCTGYGATLNAEGYAQYFVPVLARDADNPELYVETFKLMACEVKASSCFSRGGKRSINGFSGRYHKDMPVCEQGRTIDDDGTATISGSSSSASMSTTTAPEPTGTTSDELPKLVALEDKIHDDIEQAEKDLAVAKQAEVDFAEAFGDYIFEHRKDEAK